MGLSTSCWERNVSFLPHLALCLRQERLSHLSHLDLWLLCIFFLFLRCLVLIAEAVKDEARAAAHAYMARKKEAAQERIGAQVSMEKFKSIAKEGAARQVGSVRKLPCCLLKGGRLPLLSTLKKAYLPRYPLKEPVGFLAFLLDLA